MMDEFYHMAHIIEIDDVCWHEFLTNPCKFKHGSVINRHGNLKYKITAGCSGKIETMTGPVVMWFHIDIHKRLSGHGINVLSGVKSIIDGLKGDSGYISDDQLIVRFKLTIREIESRYKESAHIEISPYGIPSHAMGMDKVLYFPGKIPSIQPAIDTSASRAEMIRKINSYYEECNSSVIAFIHTMKALSLRAHELHILCVFGQPKSTPRKTHCTKAPDVDNILRFFLMLLDRKGSGFILPSSSKFAVYKYYNDTDELYAFTGHRVLEPGVYIQAGRLLDKASKWIDHR